MIKNYFSVAFRNFLKNRLFTTINILGLSIGLAACILIGLYVQEETSYDKHWENAERIYRVNTSFDIPGRTAPRVGFTSMLALPALQRYFPGEIELAARVREFPWEVLIGASTFNETIAMVDSDLVQLLEFDVLAGSLEVALDDGSSIAVSVELAKRWFSEEEAIGQVVSLIASSPVS